MKLPTFKAAQILKLHPANLLLYIATIDSSVQFDDVWPEIDESWMETIRRIYWQRFTHANDDNQASVIRKPKGELHIELNANSVLIIDKLMRKRRWGSASVSMEAIQNLTHLSSGQVEEALNELVKCDLIINHGRSAQGPYSLNSTRKEEIERLNVKNAG